MKNEVEAKFLSIDKNTIRSKLTTSGFNLKIPEYMMRRRTFDIPSENKKWGRVRQEFDKVTMAVKEIKGGGINDTYEIELTVNDFELATDFFSTLNYPAKSFQENLREVWTRDEIEITIDTWPGLNPFVEIEGNDERKIIEVSNELDFNYKKAIFGSIDLVYEKELGISSKKIIELTEITFSNPPNKNVA